MAEARMLAKPHRSRRDELLGALDVDEARGLSEDEAHENRERYGANVLPTGDDVSALRLFAEQFRDFLIVLLLLAAVVSFLAGQNANGVIILVVVLFNATMGFVQEYRAEKAVESIKDMVEHEVEVLRDETWCNRSAEDVVVGDVVHLREGDAVAADGRLLSATGLRIDEASLTGESEPVTKSVSAFEDDEEVPIADRENMAWKGTHIVQGEGRMLVTSVGESTELGKIAQSIESIDDDGSNFREKTARLARKMAFIALSTSAVVFALGYFYRDFSLREVVMVTIATLVSSIPEGLPVVISIVLAIGASRMAKNNAIIREFTATEVLGSVSTILTDKTGTLTRSVLTVTRAWTSGTTPVEVEGSGHALDGALRRDGEEISANDSEALATLLAAARWCNQAQLGEEPSGDPTEIALRVLGEKAQVAELDRFAAVKVLADLPFSTEEKMRATAIDEDGPVLLVAGAPERVLACSTRIVEGDDERGLEDDDRARIEETNERWGADALRVLALARRKLPETPEELDFDQVRELTFVGLVGMIDPAREGVEDAIQECQRAGIRVMMVTGDHATTAAAIARNVGILPADAGDEAVLSEGELRHLSDEALDERLGQVRVFARVEPKSKLRIAERLQCAGELIAMTGDGINDAPALEKADVGIAMGQRGTDVAKDAAQIVLSDDDFSTIVKAIREGRVVFKNVKTTAYFLLTTNFASTATLIAALAMGLPIPLLAVQILWVNMVTDGLMDVAKATEPGHGSMMDRDPIAPDERILTWDVMPYLLLMATLMVVLAIAAFRHYLPQGIDVARSAAFFIVATTQVFNAFNMRDLGRSVFSIGLFSNRWINAAFVASLALQLAVVKIPWLSRVFGLGDLPYLDIGILVLLSSSVLWVGELYKWARHSVSGARAAH